MSAVVADTHAILWYLIRDPQLSTAARAAMNATTASGDPIYVSAITLVEVLYLVEKGRLSVDDRKVILEAIDSRENPARLAPLDRDVADSLESVKRDDVPDMPDRIIAATAIALRVPLISRDGKIRASQVHTIC